MYWKFSTVPYKTILSVLVIKKVTSIGVDMDKAIILDHVSLNDACETFKYALELFVGGAFGNVADK